VVIEMSITISDKGVRKITEIFLKQRDISKYISSAEYNSLRRFINGNTNLDITLGR